MRIPMMVWILMAATVAQARAAGPTEPAEVMRRLVPVEKQPHLPLVVVESWTYSEKLPEMPVITLGCLPEGTSNPIRLTPQNVTPGEQAGWSTFPFGNAKGIEAVKTGKASFTGAVAGRPSLVMLAAPYLNVRQQWMPSEVTREGNTLTLHVYCWDGPPGNDKNFDRRMMYLISLGSLAEGDYTFSLRVEHLTWQSGGIYAGGAREWADAKFVVGKEAGAGVPAGEPLKIMQQNMESAMVNRAMALSLAPQVHWSRSLPQVPQSTANLQVGRLDAAVYFSKDIGGIPTVQPVKEGEGGFAKEELCAVITGPRLNSGEWIALQEIQVDAGKCRLIVNVWRDQGGRRANIPQTPYLVVPLTFLSAGECLVSVEWRRYLAPRQDQPYVFQEDNGLAEPRDTSRTITVK